MHLVKSSVRYKFFEIPDFAEFLRFCLIFVRIIKISLVFAGFSTNMRISRIYGWTSLLYEVPGGNQVDGLPPVASNNSKCKLLYCLKVLPAQSGFAATLAGKHL